MSRTSRAAHQAIQPSVAVLRARVAKYISNQGATGATDEEVQLALTMNGNTQRPRRWELIDMGVVKDSGRTRSTQAKRQAIIWVFVTDPDERETLKAAAEAETARREVIAAINHRLAAMDIDSLRELLEDLT